MTPPNKETAQIADRFLAYLREQLNDAAIAYDLPLTRLLGGFETSIYQFKLSGVQEAWNKHLVLRLYPERYGPENAVRESRVQNALAKQGYPVAKAHLVCTDKSILSGAFFVMDFLPGDLLIAAPVETIPEILGRAHATLHKRNPASLIASLNEQGIDEDQCRLDDQSDLEQNVANEFPWIRDGINWLIEHRPSEPAHFAICHGAVYYPHLHSVGKMW
jgi:aminoglycoside phosphotransferase (APT) family kinase protein